MTTVLDGKILGTPAVHALVIGVGEYPFLKGGSDERPEHWNLGQLTSAPLSAMAVANWLSTSFALPSVAGQPERRLGSIELLVSQEAEQPTFQAAGGGAPVPVGRADMQSVKDAFDRWFDRANAREDNIALFFFSGHGVEKGQWRGLLLQGFDPKKKNPFDDMIDFDGLALGMDSCLARQQLFLVDACRNTPPELLAKIGAERGESLIAASADTPSDVVRDLAVIRATAAHQSAYGVPGEPTRFTSALLRALDGAGCTQLDDRWQVRTDNLVFHLNALLRWESRTKILPEQIAKAGGDSAGFALHVPAAPKVPVIVGCEPDTDTALANFSIKAGDQTRNRPPEAADWELVLELAEYEVSAAFGAGKPERKQTVLVRPPLCPVKL